MAPPRAPSAAACPDGSPPGATVSPQSPVPRAGTTACGAGPAPSDLECRPDPGEGRPCGAVAPHHSTPAPSLRVAASAQTAGPMSARPAPHAAGQAGGPQPHRGSTGAGPGTLGLGTAERRAHADQPRYDQAHEARQAAGPDATPTAAPVALLRTPSSP